MTKLSQLVPGWRDFWGSLAEQGSVVAGDATVGNEPLARTVFFAPPPLPATDVRFPLVDDLDAEEWEVPPQLVSGVLAKGSIAVLYGLPETGKSTLAFALATSVATGRPWLGRETIAGTVLYIASEGRGGLGARIRAAKLELGVSGRIGVYFVRDAVQLATEHEDLIESVVKQLVEQPSLVVIDTLSRAMLGAKENDVGDMSLVVAGAEAIRNATGATILLIHHTTKDGGDERGSGALRAAVDTMLKCQRTGSIVQVTSEKSRDLPMFEPIAFSIEAIEGGPVVRAAVKHKLSIGNKGEPKLPAQRLRALQSLSELGGEDVGSNRWREATGVPPSTFADVVKGLVAAHLVEKRPQGRNVLYTILDAGRAALTGRDNGPAL